MTWVYAACLAALVLSVALVVTRVEQGPSMLDRAISVDVITAALMGFVAVLSAMTGRTDLVALLASLALVGFISTVTIARFAAAESDEERRILTREELEALLAREPELTDDDAPIHDVDAPARGAVAPDDGGPDDVLAVTDEAAQQRPDTVVRERVTQEERAGRTISMGRVRPAPDHHDDAEGRPVGQEGEVGADSQGVARPHGSAGEGE